MFFNIMSYLAFGAMISFGAMLVYKNIKLYTNSIKAEKQFGSIFSQTAQLADFKLIQSDDELRIKNKGKDYSKEIISFKYYDYIGNALFKGR